MDDRRFDALARSLAAPKTRRGLLGGLVAFAAGALGASAQTCPPGQTPNRKGDCSCPPGTDACPDGCFDKKRDLNNCGACGRSCAGGECRKGECRCPDGRQPSSEYGCFDPIPCGTGYCNPGAGEVCRNGGCFRTCEAGNSDCPESCLDCGCTFDSVYSELFCVDMGTGIGRCSSDADCPAGTLCSDLASGVPEIPNLCTQPCCPVS